MTTTRAADLAGIEHASALGAVGPPATVQHHGVPRQGRGRVGEHAPGLRQVGVFAAPAARRRDEPFGQRLAPRYDGFQRRPHRLVLPGRGAGPVVAERSTAGEAWTSGGADGIGPA